MNWDDYPDLDAPAQTSLAVGGSSAWDAFPDLDAPPQQMPLPQAPPEQTPWGAGAGMLMRPLEMAGQALATGAKGMADWSQTPEGKQAAATAADLELSKLPRWKPARPNPHAKPETVDWHKNELRTMFEKGVTPDRMGSFRAAMQAVGAETQGAKVRSIAPVGRPLSDNEFNAMMLDLDKPAEVKRGLGGEVAARGTGGAASLLGNLMNTGRMIGQGPIKTFTGKNLAEWAGNQQEESGFEKSLKKGISNLRGEANAREFRQGDDVTDSLLDPKNVLGTAAAAVPQMAAQVGAGALAGPAGFMAVGGAAAAGDYEAEAYEKLRAQGKSEQYSRAVAGSGAALVGPLVGAIDSIPFSGTAGRLAGKVVPKSIVSTAVAKAAAKSFAGKQVGSLSGAAAEELFAEMLQGATNDIAQWASGVDPTLTPTKLDFWKRRAAEGVMGALLGAGFQGVGNAAGVAINLRPPERAARALPAGLPESVQGGPPKKQPIQATIAPAQRKALAEMQGDRYALQDPNAPVQGDASNGQPQDAEQASGYDVEIAPGLSRGRVKKAAFDNKAAAEAFVRAPSRGNLRKLIGEDVQTDVDDRKALANEVKQQISGEKIYSPMFGRRNEPATDFRDGADVRLQQTEVINSPLNAQSPVARLTERDDTNRKSHTMNKRLGRRMDDTGDIVPDQPDTRDITPGQPDTQEIDYEVPEDATRELGRLAPPEPPAKKVAFKKEEKPGMTPEEFEDASLPVPEGMDFRAAARQPGGQWAIGVSHGKKIMEDPQAKEILAKIPTGSKYVGHGQRAIVFRTPDGEIVRVSDSPRDRSSLPEVEQPIESTKVGKWTIERMRQGTPDAGETPSRELFVKNVKEKYPDKAFDLIPENTGKFDGERKIMDGTGIFDKADLGIGDAPKSEQAAPAAPETPIQRRIRERLGRKKADVAADPPPAPPAAKTEAPATAGQFKTGDAVLTTYPGADKYARVSEVHPDGRITVITGTRRPFGPLDPKTLQADPNKVIDDELGPAEAPAEQPGKGTPEPEPAKAEAPAALPKNPQDREEFLRDVIAIMQGQESPGFWPKQAEVEAEATRRGKSRQAIRAAELEWRNAKEEANAPRPAEAPAPAPVVKMPEGEDTQVDLSAKAMELPDTKPAERRSKAKLTHHDYSREEIDDIAKSLGIKTDDIPSLVGAPDDAIVNVGDMGGADLIVDITGPAYAAPGKVPEPSYKADRTIGRDEDGKLVIVNSNFKVHPGLRAKGIGAKVLAKQVQQAAAAGVDRIDMFAAKGGDMNGYIVWAKLGFDGPIPGELMNELVETYDKDTDKWVQTTKELKTPNGEKTIQELMKTAEGQHWWEEHGNGFEGTFDLKPGSVSRKALERSMATKEFRDLFKRVIGKKKPDEQLVRVNAARPEEALDAEAKTREIPNLSSVEKLNERLKAKFDPDSRSNQVSSIFEEIGPTLKRHAMGRGAQEADAAEAIQNTMLELLERDALDKFDPAKGNLAQFVSGIATHKLNAIFKVNTRAKTGIEGAVVEQGKKVMGTRKAPPPDTSFDVDEIEAMPGRKKKYSPDDKGLLKAAKDIDPEFVDNLVSIRDLRAKMGMSKAKFDKMILEYADGDRAHLSHHDYADSLTDAERAEMITDEDGQLYNGIIFNTNKPKPPRVKRVRGKLEMSSKDARTLAEVKEALPIDIQRQLPTDAKRVKKLLDAADVVFESIDAKAESVRAQNDVYKQIRSAFQPTVTIDGVVQKDKNASNPVDDMRKHGNGSRRGRDDLASWKGIDDVAQQMKMTSDEVWEVILKGTQPIPNRTDAIDALVRGDFDFLRDFLSDQDGKWSVDDMLKFWSAVGSKAMGGLQTAFHPSGALAADADFVRQAAYRRDAAIQGMVTEYEHAGRDLAAAMKEHSSIAPEVIDDAMEDPAKVASLPVSLRAPVRKIRQIVDDLTNRMIATGAIQGKALATLKANRGFYMHQQFKTFTTPGWADKIPTADWNRAIAGMRGDPQFKGLTDQQIKNLAYNLLKEGDAETTTKGNRESHLGILKDRKALPPWLKDLFGLERDPLVNSAETVRRMASLIGEMEMWNEIGVEGKKAGIFVDNRFDNDSGAEPVGGGSVAQKGVEGLFTKTEVKEAMDKFFNPQGLMNSKNKTVRWIGTGLAASSGAKTVGSVATQFNNFVSSGTGFAGKHWMSVGQKHFKEALADAGRVMKLKGIGTWHSKPTASEKARLEALHVEVANAGLLGDTASDHMLVKASRAKEMSKWKNHPWVKGTYNVLVGIPLDFYAAGDQYWKVADYLVEKAELMKAGKSEAESKEMAADRANRHNQSYKRQGVVQRTIAELPFMGGIGAFYQFDQPRMLVQRLTDIAKDLQDPKLRKRAIGHFAGMLAVNTAIPIAMVMGARLYTGITAEEEEEARKHMADWDKNATMFSTGRDKDGNIVMFNIGRMTQLGGLMKALTAAYRGGGSEAAMEWVSPIVNPKLTTEAGFDIIRNRTAAGRQVFNPEDSAGNIALDAVGRVTQAFTPGVVDAGTRVVKSFTDPTGETGRKYNTGDEIAGFFGARPTTVDVRKSLEFKAKAYTARMQNAAKLLSDPAKKGKDLATAHANMERARQAIFDDLWREIGAARVVMGNSSRPLNDPEIADILKSGGMGKQDSRDVVKGIHKVKAPDFAGATPKQQAELAKLASAAAKEKGGDTYTSFQDAEEKRLLTHLGALSAPRPSTTPPKRKIGEKVAEYQARKERHAESLAQWSERREAAREYVGGRGLSTAEVTARYKAKLKTAFKRKETQAEHLARMRKSLAGS